jgi:hypothetical protein
VNGRRSVSARLLAAVFAAAFGSAGLLAGCGGDVATLSFPNPPPQPAAPPTTQSPLASLGGVEEAVAAGTPTTTAPVSIGPGDAELTGSVLGPAGPVAGATVEADRFVGDQEASVLLTTRADGSWVLPNILGGRYRIRAWQPPSLDMVEPQILFLSAGQHLSITLQVSEYKGPNVAVAIDPPSPVLGQAVSLAVEVTDPTVGSDGVVTNPPVAGTSVALVDGPDWTVANGNPLVTDSYGEAVFDISCTAPGDDPLSAKAGSAPPVPLQMPPCAEPPPPSTVPSTTPPSTQPPSVTTTTCPPAPATTTGGFGLGGPPPQTGC